ncbi:MAG: hypothetical protein K8T10_07080 [Candidatus Eremiobacteraeota bacterium]|nr:hypothetical protein [Candidatus Eremiobacteraeota bacterium]
MLKYNGRIDPEIRGKLRDKLNIGRIDNDTLDQVTTYLFTIVNLLDGMRKAYSMWLDKSQDNPVKTRDFIVGSLNIMSLLKKIMERMDGIVGMYVSRLDLPRNNPDENYQPWQYDNLSRMYDPLGGTFEKLREAGLKQDFIDMYYIDGSLMEVYESCLNILPAFYILTETENPNPIEIKDGILLLEDSMRKMYNKLFIEEYEDLRGLMGVMQAALKKVE